MSGPLSAIRVLVADDNPHMRRIIASLLDGLGVRHVVECANGAEALETMRRWSTDIAIVDLLMNPIDGVEFTYLVRNASDSTDPYLPIVMLTAHAEKTKVYEARDAGVTEFIVKPITGRALVDRLNAVIFKPRPFIKSGDYHGPCRRRRQDPQFAGPWLRHTDEQSTQTVTMLG